MAVLLTDLSPQARAKVEEILGPKRRKRADPAEQKENLAATLVGMLRMAGVEIPEREVRFHPTRDWRFDLAWPDRKFAVEADGGTWTKGGHVRGKHFESDCEKGNEAILLGWRVMHVTTDQIHDGRALVFIERFLAL